MDRVGRQDPTVSVILPYTETKGLEAEALYAEGGGEMLPWQVALTCDIMGVDEVIDRAPTIDAVPVVRCKDCKWWTKQEKSIQGRCALTGTYPTGGWYCGNGERKDDDTD